MIRALVLRHEFDLQKLLSASIEVARKGFEWRQLPGRFSDKPRLGCKEVKNISTGNARTDETILRYYKTANVNMKEFHPSNVKVLINKQSIKVNDNNVITIVPFKLTIKNTDGRYNLAEKLCGDTIYVKKKQAKISIPEGSWQIIQAKLDETNIYLTLEKENCSVLNSNYFLGIDCNASGWAAIAASPKRIDSSGNEIKGIVKKFGSGIDHVHKKYRDLNRSFQQKDLLNKLTDRAADIVLDIQRKEAVVIVQCALDNKLAIKMENLTGILSRANSKIYSKELRARLNSWGYYQMQQLIVLQAEEMGVPVFFVNPAFTSQTCSVCGKLGVRESKSVFKCSDENCRYHKGTDADVNAAYNISKSELIVSPGEKGVKEMQGWWKQYWIDNPPLPKPVKIRKSRKKKDPKVENNQEFEAIN